jgi:hypothetical protein
MNKLDAAINRLIQRARQSHDEDPIEAILADALEEIRDLLTADKQPNTEDQPTTFEPWDCVRAKPGTELHTYVGDVELVCGHFDSDGDRRVLNPDSDEMHTAYFYSKDSDLIFVRRLKARDQAEDTEPTFAARYINDAQAAPTFQVGDWVQRENGLSDQITAVREWLVNTKRGYVWPISALTKIDPPTPRFTFGQRVRHYEVTGLFIRYIRSQVGITKEQCQFLGLTDNNIHTCYAEELSLLDELPF